MSPNEMRLLIAVLGAIVLAAIYFFGRPDKGAQGRRRSPRADSGERVEPTIGDDRPDDDHGDNDVHLHDELDRLGQSINEARDDDDRVRAKPAARSTLGARSGDQAVERIVTLFVAARAGSTIGGSDFVVAAEKCGLEFGDLGIFHRLADGKREGGPIFSVANMVKPGHFDMSKIDSLETPGVSFFMALPGALSALDAWDTMLPTAQRLAELLDAVVLDEQRNALGRQRIAHIRDDLRAWDRKQQPHPPGLVTPATASVFTRCRAHTLTASSSPSATPRSAA
jgi:cell division protein ZipA